MTLSTSAATPTPITNTAPPMAYTSTAGTVDAAARASRKTVPMAGLMGERA